MCKTYIFIGIIISCFKWDLHIYFGGGGMVLNTFFDNISVILCWSVLLVEVTGIPGENHRPATSHGQLYHIILYQVHLT
jgi:hypothetical protein